MEKYNTDVLKTIMEAQLKHKDNKRLVEIAKKMFSMYTDMGFPPDMFLNEMDKQAHLQQSKKIFIVSEYQALFLEHRRKSGVQDKNIDKIRRKNREDMERFIETGELSIY